MVQKILIFNCFIILFLSNNILNAKNIIGKAKVIDGDTININSKKIRMHGIDAPEIKQNCTIKKKEWACGKQSAFELKKIINNQITECKVTDIDIYNRYLAICLVNGININKMMVKKGWALAYRFYSKDYIVEEKYAREYKLGIWIGKFEEPYLYRKKNK